MTTKEIRKQQTIKLLIKWGSNEETANKRVEKNFDTAFSCCPEGKASYFAEFVSSVD